MKHLNQPSQIFNIKSIRYFLMLAMLSLTLISFTGCGSDDSTSVDGNPNPDNGGNEEPTDNPGPNEVGMEGVTFTISNLEVEAGTTVTWTNTSDVNHTVTSGSRGDADAGTRFDSGTMAPGDTFSFTFEDAGTFAYFCDFHAGMDAQVTVTE